MKLTEAKALIERHLLETGTEVTAVARVQAVGAHTTTATLTYTILSAHPQPDAVVLRVTDPRTSRRATMRHEHVREVEGMDPARYLAAYDMARKRRGRPPKAG